MDLSPLELKLKIKFKDRGLLTTALTHRSYLNEYQSGKIESNERLEYLGDAVLELAVSKALYLKRPEMTEGGLTNLRSNLVRTTTLARAAKRLNLGVFLRLSRGEDESRGRENQSLLADAVEALIGAIYLDQGFEKTESFIEKHLLVELDSILAKGSLKDDKSLFQEAAQADCRQTPIYKVVSESGPDHAKEFKVAVWVGKEKLAVGKGKSKQEGEQNAARLALDKWPKR